MKKYWFGPKDADFGVKSWQGWVAILLLIAGIFAIRFYVAAQFASLLPLTANQARVVLTLAWLGGFLLVAKIFYDPEG